MGLLDFLQRRTRPAAPALRVVPPRPDPSLPAPARIASFDLLEEVGTLALEGGATLRFGRSACRGFEPVADARVVVRATSPHPLWGVRAAAIDLDGEPAAYDALLAARDARLGLPPPADAQQAAAAARGLGWVVVLFDEAPPAGPRSFRAWAERLGLPARGVRVQAECAHQLRLGAGRHDALVVAGTGPWPRPEDVGAPADGPAGAGFVALSLGPPGAVAAERGAGLAEDPWAPDGPLRDLSRITAALLEAGGGVVLPQAGRWLPRERFLSLLGDLEDPEARPFGAWVDWSVDARARLYSTFGLGLHGLPDVQIATDPDDRWSLDRSGEALLLAVHRMVRERRVLGDGEVLEVPVGLRVGAGPLQPPAGDAEWYRVEAAGARLELRPAAGAAGTRGLWRAASDPVRPDPARIGVNTYTALLLAGLHARWPGSSVAALAPDPAPDVPPFMVEVLAVDDGFHLVTTGLGRVRQPGGTPEGGTAHVELVAAMRAHHPVLAGLLANVGAHLHTHPPEEVFGPGDTITFPVPEIGAAGFVLADAGPVEMADGLPVRLLELVPCGADEYRRVRTAGTRRFLEQLGPMTPAARAERWRLLLA